MDEYVGRDLSCAQTRVDFYHLEPLRVEILVVQPFLALFVFFVLTAFHGVS